MLKEIETECKKCHHKHTFVYDLPERREGEPIRVLGVRCKCGETVTEQV